MPSKGAGLLKAEPQLKLNVAMLDRPSQRNRSREDASAFAGLHSNGGSGGKTANAVSDVIRATNDELVCVVQDVERISPEFQVITFGQEELLVDAEIKVPRAWPPVDIPPVHVRGVWPKFGISRKRIGKFIDRGICDRNEVKCVRARRHGRSSSRDRRRQDQPRNLLVHGGSGVKNREWCASVCDENGGKGPTTSDLFKNPMSVAGERNVPRSSDRDAMPQIGIGIAAIQLRIERIEQPNVEVRCPCAEGRAQVVDGMRVGVVGGQIQPRVPGIGENEPNVGRVIAGKAVVFASVDGAVLLSAQTRSAVIVVRIRVCVASVAQENVTRTRTVNGIKGVETHALGTRIFDRQKDLWSDLAFDGGIV